jgi:hypothetical protein
MGYGTDRARCNVRVAALLAVLLPAAGCAPQPFDATAPWVPGQAAQDRSYTAGQRAAVPESAFDRFEREAPPAGSVELPGRGAGNPWAGQPENVVVQVCYGRLWSSRDEVDATARALCPEGAGLRYLGSDTVFNACPLLQPSRAVYRCLRPESADGADSDGSGDSG